MCLRTIGGTMFRRIRSFLAHTVVLLGALMGAFFIGAEFARAQSVPTLDVLSRPLVSGVAYLAILLAAVFGIYGLFVYGPRHANPLRRMKHWWRNELAKEIDVDEDEYMFFETDARRIVTRITNAVQRRGDRMMILEEREDTPPRIIIARS